MEKTFKLYYGQIIAGLFLISTLVGNSNIEDPAERTYRVVVAIAVYVFMADWHVSITWK